jgi:hypothetical protein
MAWNHCRFCDDWRDQRMVKYGPRHYAHFKCYIVRKKTLDALKPWQIGQFPYFLLKDMELLEHPAVLAARNYYAKREELT